MKLNESKLLFSALADETRFRILSLLFEGELCVCDLMKVMKAPQSKVSRHLAYLRRAGLVESRKQGLWMHYRLSKPSQKLFGAVLKALDCCRGDVEELTADLQEFRKDRKGLVACCK